MKKKRGSDKNKDKMWKKEKNKEHNETAVFIVPY